MSYFMFFLLPVVSIIVLIVALRSGFNKQAFMVSVGITMVINMFAMHRLTWYGLICTATVSLATIYVIICLVLSIIEHRGGKE